MVDAEAIKEAVKGKEVTKYEVDTEMDLRNFYGVLSMLSDTVEPDSADAGRVFDFVTDMAPEGVNRGDVAEALDGIFVDEDGVGVDEIASRLADDFESTEEKSIEELVRERFNKSRVYVDSPEDVPDQYEAQTSERGAVYYETDGSSGGSGSVNDVLEDEFGSEVADGYQQRVDDGMDERDAAVETLVDAGLASESSEAEEMVDYMEDNLGVSDGGSEDFDNVDVDTSLQDAGVSQEEAGDILQEEGLWDERTPSEAVMAYADNLDTDTVDDFMENLAGDRDNVDVDEALQRAGVDFEEAEEILNEEGLWNERTPGEAMSAYVRNLDEEQVEEFLSEL